MAPSKSVWERLKETTPYLIFVICISTLGTLQFGFHLAELNAPQDVITCHEPAVANHVASVPNSSLPQCIPMTEAQFALLSSMFVLGGFGGAVTAGSVSTTYGRKFAMRITAIFFIIGASLETLAGNLPVMAIGRLLGGIGAGAATVIVPIYIKEVAPPDLSGLFGVMTQVTINIGILLTQTLGFFLSQGSKWRIILGVGAGLGLLQGVGLFFIPESPSWLAHHGHPEAQQIYRRLRGKHFEDSEIQKEILRAGSSGESTPPEHSERNPLLLSSAHQDHETVVSHDGAEGLETQLLPGHHCPPSLPKKGEHHGNGFFGVLFNPTTRPAIIAVIGIMFAQQLSGINAIMMYSVSLLRGVLPVSSGLITIIISVVNLITTISCSWMPDKIGRKKCLLISIAGMGTSSFLLAVSLRTESEYLAAFSVLAFVAFFATGLGPVPFLMAPEFVTPEASGPISSWSLGANYVATFLVAQFFPLVNTWLNDGFGGKGWVFFMFAGFAGLSFLFVSTKVPETLGKKSVDEIWGRDPHRIRED